MYIKKSKVSLSILTFFIITAFLLSSFFSYFTAKQSLKEEILNSSLPLLSENIYSEIQRSLSIPLKVSSSMSRDSFLIKWVNDGEQNYDEITLYLKNIKERYNFFSTFFVSSTSSNYYYGDGVLKKISAEDDHDSWYYDFMNSGKEADLDVDTDEASDGVLTIFINYRLEDFNGSFLGVVGVGVRLDQIAVKLQEKQDKYNRNVFLVDEDGFIQVHSDIHLIEQVNIFKKEGIRNVADEIMAQSADPIEIEYKTDSQSIFVSSRYISELGWHIIVEQDEKSSYFEARKSLYLSLLITIMITGLLLFVSSHILKVFEQQMELIAGTDNLTNTANRRELIKQFEYSNTVRKDTSQRYALSCLTWITLK